MAERVTPYMCGDCGDSIEGGEGNWRHLDGTPVCTSRRDATVRKARPLHVIARDILAHWTKPSTSREWAMPYINAMRHLVSMDSTYGHDDAEDIVIRFLSNASGWRGEDARRIKAELKALLPERGRR